MKFLLKYVSLTYLSIISAEISGQFRFFKAHSDQEDRLISLDFKSFDTYRNSRQSEELIQNLYKNEWKEPFTGKPFSNENYSYFFWHNPEYFGNNSTEFSSKVKRTLGDNQGIYLSSNRFYSWESKDRKDYLVVNPLLDLSYSPNFGPFDSALLNGRGVEVYGQMGEKWAFYSQVLDYQANFPFHLDQYFQNHRVYPGIGNNQKNTFGFRDYFYATAYMDFTLLEKPNDTLNIGYKINATIGHDKQHIGAGFRSLILSNFSAPSLFLQIDYKLGPFKYQNLFKELVMDMTKDSTRTFNKKYLAMHRGSLTFDQWGLEMGFSEMVIQSRPNNGLDLNYLNPVIFYRSIERDLGSSDNILLAFDAKWIKDAWMFYGQFVIDEFNFSAVLGNRNSYLNKFGNQFGVYHKLKSAHVKQSYLQLEYNAVRPYTYSHRQGSPNHYSHYNQSLAHPLESNFRELVFKFFVVPQSLQRWSFKNTTLVAFKGLNSLSENFGSDLRIPYNTAVDKENAAMLQGVEQRRLNILNTFSYYVQPNLKVELSHQWFQSTGTQKRNLNYIFISLKYNFYDSRETLLF